MSIRGTKDLIRCNERLRGESWSSESHPRCHLVVGCLHATVVGSSAHNRLRQSRNDCSPTRGVRSASRCACMTLAWVNRVDRWCNEVDTSCCETARYCCPTTGSRTSATTGVNEYQQITLRQSCVRGAATDWRVWRNYNSDATVWNRLEKERTWIHAGLEERQSSRLVWENDCAVDVDN